MRRTSVPSWSGETALATLHRHYRDRQGEARRRHEAGHKVVGYFSNNVPEELILATGMFPVQLTGDPRDTTEIADIYLDEVFDGCIKSIFNRLFAGHFDFVDLVIVPRTSEAFLQLYYFIEEVRRWEPDRRVPELYLFDFLQTPFHLTSQWNRSRLNLLRNRLEHLAGAPIAKGALRQAIATVNQDRHLLRQAASLWRGPTLRLSGIDALAIIGSGWFMDRAEHAALLGSIIEGSSSLPARVGPRVMIKGSPHDNSDFYRLVDETGGAIVASDHVFGDPTFASLVDEDADPMDALTGYYQLQSPSIRSYPQSRQDEQFMALVEIAAVEGVVFYHDEYDDTLGWDYPQQKRLLDARGIPSLFLGRQSYRHPDRGAQRSLLREFLAGIARPEVAAR
jgi:benzoyl-CoA reductase/2-hydroxyglutaryl-CoA dehydratase subunit BcrC/BadD/HgdB